MDECRTDTAFLLLERGNLAGGVTHFVVTWTPAMTPMSLDYEAFHPRPPGSGKNVAFMDGPVGPLPNSHGNSA